MGNDHSQIAHETGLLEAEVKRLELKFDALRQSADGRTKHDNITEASFISHFGSSQVDLAKLTFNAIDVHRQGFINFRDFCAAVAILSHGSEDDKLEYAFNLYDHHHRGVIDTKDFAATVSVFRHSSQRLLEQLGVHNPDLTSDRDAAEIVMSEMSQSNAQTDHITKDEFKAFCRTHPEIFKQVQTSFHALQQAALWDWEKTERPAHLPKPSLLPSDCAIM